MEVDHCTAMVLSLSLDESLTIKCDNIITRTEVQMNILKSSLNTFLIGTRNVYFNKTTVFNVHWDWGQQ